MLSPSFLTVSSGPRRTIFVSVSTDPGRIVSISVSSGPKWTVSLHVSGGHVLTTCLVLVPRLASRLVPASTPCLDVQPTSCLVLVLSWRQGHQVNEVWSCLDPTADMASCSGHF